MIRRADGSWLYMLPSAIDDVDMGVTDVVRGEDHVTNTATQIQMFEALGAPPPRFAHEALLTGSEGKLSKRLGSLGVEAFRDQGIEPVALKALLARLGTSDPVEPVTDIAPLIETIDFHRFGRAPARFDEGELAQLNARIIHKMDYDSVRRRLPDNMSEDGWDAIRPNLTRMDEAADLWSIVEGPVEAAIASEDLGFVGEAMTVADQMEWATDPWHALTNRMKEASGRKGKALLQEIAPLALAYQEEELAVLDADEQATLRRLVQKLLAAQDRQ